MTDAFIYDAVRTPRGKGRKDGSLHEVTPVRLAVTALQALRDRNKLDTHLVDDIVLGCVMPIGEQGADIARTAAVVAGYAETVSGVQVNRFCASGLEAVNMAARTTMLGEGDFYLAGGVESMSRAPWVMPKPETGLPRGEQTMYDTTLGWRMVNPRMAQLYSTESMGETGENVAERHGVSRDDQDQFALRSHQRAVAAAEDGRFAEEIVPVPVDGDGALERDEGPRPDTSIEKLAKLRPAFRDGGSVTAGNSSTLNDGAACLLIGTADAAEQLGTEPLARIVSFGVSGVDPAVMGMGPAEAIPKALAAAGLRMGDVDLVEINEAFASQVLACARELGIDDERLNVNGGAIALGHPLGCSGARLMTTLVRELRRRGGRYGVASLCVGVGQGLATVVEAV